MRNFADNKSETFLLNLLKADSVLPELVSRVFENRKLSYLSTVLIGKKIIDADEASNGKAYISPLKLLIDKRWNLPVDISFLINRNFKSAEMAEEILRYREEAEF